MAGAPFLSVEQLRAIFLKPDCPLEKPDDDVEPCECRSSKLKEVAIAVHDCPTNDYHWIELWATPDDSGHEADQWSADWFLVDESNVELLGFVNYCPFCGVCLYGLINQYGYYTYTGHDDEKGDPVGNGR